MSANEDELVDPGLHAKYHVGKDGEPVEECFVLEPDSDPAARAALRTYAAVTDNDRLADDLREWLARYDDEPTHVPIDDLQNLVGRWRDVASRFGEMDGDYSRGVTEGARSAADELSDTLARSERGDDR